LKEYLKEITIYYGEEIEFNLEDVFILSEGTTVQLGMRNKSCQWISGAVGDIRICFRNDAVEILEDVCGFKKKKIKRPTRKLTNNIVLDYEIVLIILIAISIYLQL
jgi:hypothetical protein